MKHMYQKGPHCLLYAAACILEEDPDVLRKEIGYTGNEVWWPEAPPPTNIRSFHIQEIHDCFIRRGYVLSLYEKYPRMAPKGYDDLYKLIGIREDLEIRFADRISDTTCLLIGVKPSGMKHAVAYSDHKIYDTTPHSGGVFDVDKMPYIFGIIEAWIVIKI